MAGAVNSFKLVLLGDSAVGKSCLVVRFCRGEFYDYQEPTIGAAFLTQTVQLGTGSDASTVRFELWDTAGQERYRALAPMYYRGAAAAVVVYDVTNPTSFEGAKSWVKELQRRGEAGCVIALAGNKADNKEARKVSAEDVKEYAAENGCLAMETSAKTGLNVKELFVAIAKKMPKQSRERDPDLLAADLKGDSEEGGGKSGGCCGGK